MLAFLTRDSTALLCLHAFADMSQLFAEEDGLSESAVEKLSKLKVFQHLRERHKKSQHTVQSVGVLSHWACMLPITGGLDKVK